MSQAKPRLTSTTYEFPIRGPPEKKSLREAVYDSETGKILGRTAKGWGQLLLFYLIFYTVLASLFAICLQGLFLSIDEHEPTWVLEESLIGTNPGVGYRPIPDDADENPIIRYSAGNKTQVDTWVGILDRFLEPYRNKSKLPGGGRNQIVCSYDTRPDENEVCAFDVETNFQGCTSNDGYSYNKSSPCIFIKLNKIIRWVPDYYRDINELPDDMPESLKTHIRGLPLEERDQIWVSCDGHTQADKESLDGKLEYFPGPGIPGFYFPYTNTRGYLSPLVAVRVLRLPVGQIINLECRLWAKNIKYRGGRERTGSLLLEIMVE